MKDDETVAIKTKDITSNPASRIPWKIYVSRALSAWGDRLWSFGAGVFMVNLAPENLRLVSIYGLVLSVSVIVFGAFIGAWIDKTSRLRSAQVFLAIQNVTTAITCIILGLYFHKSWQDQIPSWVVEAIPIITIVLAAVAQVASVGSKIVVEKDWIVVISLEDDDRLATINSIFRTIDLATLSLAPLSAGLIFDFISDEAAAFFIAGWNLVSVVFEYLLLKSIYLEFPQLAHKNVLVENNEEPKSGGGPCRQLIEGVQAWILYMKCSVRNAGFGLACLYMTVLGFDNITYGYCLQQCVRESILGALVGVSAVIGVSGSILFPSLRKCLGLAKTGLVGFSLLIAALTLCLVSIWLDGSPFNPSYFQEQNDDSIQAKGDPLGEDCSVPSYLSVSVLMAGIISARFGLWLSDLTITQIIQENVEEEHRGVIGGVQNALNSLMDTIKFILVIALPQQETFGWLIIASYAFICLGAISYASYALNRSSRKPQVKNPVTTYQSNGEQVVTT